MFGAGDRFHREGDIKKSRIHRFFPQRSRCTYPLILSDRGHQNVHCSVNIIDILNHEIAMRGSPAGRGSMKYPGIPPTP